MPNTQLFLELYDYNRYANGLFIEILQELNDPPEKAISFINHIFNAHQIWLNRIYQEGPSFGVWQSHQLSEWIGLNDQLNERTKRYLQQDPENRAFHSILTYQNSKGQSFNNLLQEIYFHVINHSTHHRAQIALLLRQIGIAPPASDYIFYKR